MNMTPASYSDCLREMFALGRFGIKLELDTIAGILSRLGSPEKQFKTIHIAGTNGKGSIASYIASILKHSGVRTALYTSPHLIRFNERFMINGAMVSDGEIVEAYTSVKAADIGERKATFFEITTAMAFHIFAQKGVEWAVIETGMGGRLDATNILQPELTIISNLSIEHTEYLGETLEEIAGEKAGIIKTAVPVITGVSQSSALKVIHDKAKEHCAPVYELGRDFEAAAAIPIPEADTAPCESNGATEPLKDSPELLSHAAHAPGENSTRFSYRGIHFTWKDMETRLPGPHQIHNAALALAACELLMAGKLNQEQNRKLAHDFKGMTQESIKQALHATSWPGRLEYILQNPTVIIDGAHNLQAAENLGSYLGKKKDSVLKAKDSTSPAPPQYILVIGILDDKPYQEMLAHLLPPADRIIFTKAKIDRSLEPEILKKFAETISHADIEVMEDVGSAVAHALKSSSKKDCICIAGSLYVAGEAKDKIQKDFPGKMKI